MIARLTKGAVALIFLGGAVLIGTPSFAVEPDVDSAAGPELPAPRTSDPDFQFDDQTGALLAPETEGAEPNARDVVVVPPEPPPPPPY